MTVDNYVVPGRECGSCTACCTELAIVTDEMKKPCGVACEHCVGGGCAIYATRPQLCRDYYCVWRSIPDMPDSWRPDRSGVLLMHEAPVAGYPAPFGISIVVTGGPEIVQSDEFAMMAAGFIDQRTPTYLNLPGTDGNWGHKQMLNDDLSKAVAARELPRVKAILWGMYLYLKSLPTRPITEDELLASRRY
jgi:hypothetical protein